MSELKRAIAEQPALLRRLARSDVGRPSQVLARASRVLVAGTGSSLHAADLGAGMLRSAGLEAWSCSCFDLARSGRLRSDDALIVITHTGETAYAQIARQQALDAGVAVVSITGNGVKWPEAIETGPRERSETYTRSYLGAVAILSLLAGELGAPRLGREGLQEAADAVERVLATPPSLPVGERLTVLVGAGPWAVTAREGALKLREAAGLVAEGYDPEYLLHGSAVPLGPSDALLAVAPGQDRTGLVARVADAARREGVAVATIDVDPVLGEHLGQLPATVVLQGLALRQAEAAGRDPDHVIAGAWADDALWNA